MRVVDLALPCRLVVLNVRLGPEQGRTTLEDVCLRAVAAGRTSIEGQTRLLGLPKRVLLDVLSGLWSEGYVSVDVDTGDISLSDKARALLTSTDGAAATAKVEERAFLFEPISGRFFSDESGLRRPSLGSIVLPVHAGIDESQLPLVELVRAVQAVIRRQRQRGFRQTVLDVSFGHPSLRPPSELRWLTVRVAVRVDEYTNRLLVEPLESAYGTWRSRELLAAHVAALADEEPTGPVAVGLRASAERALAEPELTESLVRRFRSAVEPLASLPSDQVAKQHEHLRSLSARLQERISFDLSQRAGVTAVREASGHLWAVEDLCRSATRQLVIAASVLDYRALQPILDHLRAALERGVRVVLMWGNRPGYAPRPNVLAALDELNLRFPGRITMAPTSACAEANLVIQDDQRALVASWSLFAASAQTRRGQLGILIEPVTDHIGPVHAVTDLLAWVREHYPVYTLGRVVRTNVLAGEDIRSPSHPGGLTRADSTNGELSPPALPDDIDAAGHALWAESWSEYQQACAAVVESLARSGTSVQVVSGGRHRDLVIDAVRHAERLLVLCDDRLDSRVVDKRFTKLLAESSARGVDVHVICPKHDGSGAQEDPLDGLPAPLGTFVVRREQRMARVVVMDDRALVTSFSPLGDPVHWGAPGATRSHQLGVLLRGRSVSRELAEALRVCELPADLPAPAAPTVDRTDASAAAVALPLLLEARVHRGTAAFGPFVATRLLDLKEPEGVLRRWIDSAVPAAELRASISAWLGTGRCANEHAWLDWLIRDAWGRRAFVEAALLAQGTDSPPVPMAALVAASAIEHGPLGAAWEEVVLELIEESADARAVGAAGGLADVLLRGAPEGLAPLDLFGEHLPSAWRRLVAAAVEFHRDGRAALPLRAIRLDVRSIAERDAVETEWRGLGDAVEKLRRLRQRFAFDSGEVMHDGLFAAGGVLTAVARACADDPGARREVATVLPNDVQRHLEGIVQRAGAPPVQWSKQLHFLRTVGELVRTARRLANDQRSLAGRSSSPVTMRHTAELASRVAESWDVLYGELAQLRTPYEQPFLWLLDELRPLAAWNGQAE